jgi:hypothetical protein
MSDHKGQGIIRTGRGEEQPADKERAQTARRTEPGHIPSQPVIKETSGFTGDRAEAHEEVQRGAAIVAKSRASAEPVMSERLMRAATGPLNPRTGRRPAT